MLLLDLSKHLIYALHTYRAILLVFQSYSRFPRENYSRYLNMLKESLNICVPLHKSRIPTFREASEILYGFRNKMSHFYGIFMWKLYYWKAPWDGPLKTFKTWYLSVNWTFSIIINLLMNIKINYSHVSHFELFVWVCTIARLVIFWWTSPASVFTVMSKNEQFKTNFLAFLEYRN